MNRLGRFAAVALLLLVVVVGVVVTGLPLASVVSSSSLCPNFQPALLAFGLESVIEGGAAVLAARHLRHLADEEEDHERREQKRQRAEEDEPRGDADQARSYGWFLIS